jgi:pimeloyl-ACP methyl ester carboxylesterase
MNWLLLRGLLREKRHWLGFDQYFAQVVPDARVHTLDLPGIGTEEHRRSPTSVDGIVDDLRARWLALRDHHPEPWGIFSVSLGGMVALRWARRYPDDWRRIIVTNTSGADLGRPTERFTWRAVPTFPRMALGRDVAFRERALLRFVTVQTERIPELADTFAEIAPPHEKFRDTAYRQLLAASRVRVGREPLPQPTLVLASAGDRLVDPVCSFRLARRIQAPLRVHPWGGHDLPLDAPGWVAEQVRHWVEENPLSASS